MASAGPKTSVQTVVVAALVYGCLLLHLCRGQCPEDGGVPSPVLDDKVAGSEVVVQGQVRRQVKVDAARRYSSFTAEVSVQCVYKGGPVSSVINVTRAGTVEIQGRCVRTTLSVGSVNLIYLRRAGDHYVPTFREDPADSKYLEELEYACGLSVQFPTGMKSATSDSCQPDKFGDDDYNDCADTSPSPTPSASQPCRPDWTVFGAVCSLLLTSVLHAVS